MVRQLLTLLLLLRNGDLEESNLRKALLVSGVGKLSQDLNASRCLNLKLKVLYTLPL